MWRFCKYEVYYRTRLVRNRSIFHNDRITVLILHLKHPCMRTSESQVWASHIIRPSKTVIFNVQQCWLYVCTVKPLWCFKYCKGTEKLLQQNTKVLRGNVNNFPLWPVSCSILFRASSCSADVLQCAWLCIKKKKHCQGTFKLRCTQMWKLDGATNNSPNGALTSRFLLNQKWISKTVMQPANSPILQQIIMMLLFCSLFSSRPLLIHFSERGHHDRWDTSCARVLPL